MLPPLSPKVPYGPSSGRDPLFVLRLRLQFGVGRRRCRRTLRLFRSASREFLLLTPFRLRPLLFLPLHFLLALFERDAHRSPQKSGATPTSLRIVGLLPARFARLASRFAVILMRESAAPATTTGASTAAITARGALTLGPRFVDLEVAASHFFSVKSGNGLRCLGVI